MSTRFAYSLMVLVLGLVSGCTVYSTPAQEPSPAPEAEPPPPPERHVHRRDHRHRQPEQPSQPPQTAPSQPTGLKAHPPVWCTGNDKRVVEGVYIEQGTGNGIEVQGNCHVVVINSHIRAGLSGILIEGNGSVQVQNSVIEGKKAAVMILGGGVVEAQGTRFIGAKEIKGNGKVSNQGGNTWN